MCVQDIKIGRTTQCNSKLFVANNTAPVLLFAANPDRVAIAVGYVQGGTIASASFAVLREGTGQVAGVILGVSAWTPYAETTIERRGKIIQGEIWGNGNDAGSAQIIATETILLQELDKI